MKQTLLILVALCAITINVLQAQTAPNASENLPAFSTVIPKLQLLQTGYPKVEDRDSVAFTKSGKNFKFIGKKVTSKDLNDKIKDYLMGTKKEIWKDAPIASIGKLSIYCETFELQDNIWLPETNIDIQAKNVFLHGYSINTSPLTWRNAIKFDTLSSSSTSPGNNGGNAGNIQIICDRFEKGHTDRPFIADGGQGEAVRVPTVTIDYPTNCPKKIDIYKFHGCTGAIKGEKSGQKGTWYNTDDYLVVAARFDNASVRVIGDDTECTGYESYDTNFQWNEGDGTIKDNLADTRLKYATLCVPGEGGKAGKITLVVRETSGIESVSTKNGDKGHYIARTNKSGDLISNYGTADQPTNAVTFYEKNYRVMRFNPVSDKTGGIVIYDKYNDKYKPEVRTHTIFKMPSDTAQAKVNNALKQGGSKGEAFQTQPTQQAYVAHLDYLRKRLDDLEIRYSAYFQLNKDQQTALDSEIDEFAGYLAAIGKDKKLDNLQKMDGLALAHKAAELASYKIRNIDASGNVAGYRPMLSLTSTLEYIKNNLEADLRLYIMADIMTNKETDAKVFLNKVGEMTTSLLNVDKKLNGKLNENNKVYEGLAIKAANCETLTKEIMEGLGKVEKRIKSEGESRAQTKKTWKTISKAALKTAAMGMSLIPGAQPVLGQIAGNSLDALSNEMDGLIDGKESFGEAMVAAASKIDLSGVMKALAEKQLKSYVPNATDYTGLEKKWNDKDFEKDYKEYDSKLAEQSALYLKSANTGKDILTSFTKISATTEDVEREITKLKAIDFEFEQVCQKLTRQNQLKTEIFSDLNNAVQKDMAIQSDILKNRITLIKLNKRIDATEYNQNLEEALSDITNSALKRLKWVEYQLVKSFEYTTLTPFEEKMPCSEVFIETYRRDKPIIAPLNLDSCVKVYLELFTAQRKKVGDYILQDHDLNKYKTDVDFSKRLMLSQDDEKDTDTKGSELLAELNTKRSVVLDLQRDFVNEIIRPDESHSRIKEIKLMNVKFETELSKNASIEVKLEVLDEGIVRKDKNLFIFKTGDPNKVSDIWTWELKNTNEKLDIFSDGQSSEYKNLINFLITGETSASTKDSISRFTAPPAWSRCRLSIMNNNNVPMPKLTYLEFGLKCDRLKLSDNRDVVLDIKLQNAPIGVTYTVIKNNAAVKPEDTHTQNDYEIVNNGTSVKIKLTEPDDANMKFDKWHLYSQSKGDGVERSGNELSESLSENLRIVAVFKKKEVTDNTEVAAKSLADKPSDTEKKKIKLYESPSLESAVIAVEHDFTNIDNIPDAEETNGFIRVVYNGTQEAYIKKE